MDANTTYTNDQISSAYADLLAQGNSNPDILKAAYDKGISADQLIQAAYSYNGGSFQGDPGPVMENYIRGQYASFAPKPPAPPPAPISVAQLGSPTPWNVTPEQTVEGRINSIINPNNPLMVQARTQAAQDSNSKGLINSSMAVTAGQDAMYRAATPIATTDAGTFAKAAGYNADENNQFAVHNVDALNQITMAQLQAGTQTSIAALNASTQEKIATLDANTRTTLAAQQNDNQVLLNTSSQAAQAFNQYVVAAANIQNNPNLDAANKTSALQTLWTTTYSQLKVLGSISGLDLTSLLDMTGVPGANAPPAPAAPPPAGIINGATDMDGGE